MVSCGLLSRCRTDEKRRVAIFVAHRHDDVYRPEGLSSLDFSLRSLPLQHGLIPEHGGPREGWQLAFGSKPTVTRVQRSLTKDTQVV